MSISTRYSVDVLDHMLFFLSRLPRAECSLACTKYRCPLPLFYCSSAVPRGRPSSHSGGAAVWAIAKMVSDEAPRGGATTERRGVARCRPFQEGAPDGRWWSLRQRGNLRGSPLGSRQVLLLTAGSNVSPSNEGDVKTQEAGNQ